MSKNILLVHASPRSGGNSSILADWFERGALEAGTAVTRVAAGHANISGCMACEYCFSHDGTCVQDDDMQKFYPLLHEADVIVYATHMYFYNFPAQLRAFQDRMFCGVTKPFGITATALLLCFEDKDVSTCDPVVDSYRVAANYCKQENLGEVIVNNVYEKGCLLYTSQAPLVGITGKQRHDVLGVNHGDLREHGGIERAEGHALKRCELLCEVICHVRHGRDLFLGGIDVNHDVLDLGKRMLDVIMDALGDGVGVRQLHRAVDCDFHVDVDLVPEHARAQHVDCLLYTSTRRLYLI